MGSPFLEPLREAARRVVDACNAPYPTKVHTSGYIHRGVEDGSTGAIRGLFHPDFDAPVFAEFYSSPEMMEFVHSWTGLTEDQLAFGVPLIFCNSVKNDDYQWTPGGGGWQYAAPRRDLAPPRRFAHSPAFAAATVAGGAGTTPR